MVGQGGTFLKVVDVHTHFIPREFVELIRHQDNKFNMSITKDDLGREYVTHAQGYSYPLVECFYDAQSRIREMDRMAVNISVLSISPTLFFYWAKASTAMEVARLANESLGNWVSSYPDRFIGMATVPLQDVAQSIKELERVASQFNMKAVEIGTNVESKSLSNQEFFPFFQAAERLDILLFLHPYYVGKKPLMDKFYLTNLVGNPLDTTLSIANIVFSGLLEKLPRLKLLLAHGGGFAPYQIGRLGHGYKVRPETKRLISKSPTEYLRLVYFDTITHFKPALLYLIRTFGSERVMLGSDFPFDMGDPDPVSFVNSLPMSREDKQRILGGNILNLLKMGKN